MPHPWVATSSVFWLLKCYKNHLRTQDNSVDPDILKTQKKIKTKKTNKQTNLPFKHVADIVPPLPGSVSRGILPCWDSMKDVPVSYKHSLVFMMK